MDRPFRNLHHVTYLFCAYVLLAFIEILMLDDCRTCCYLVWWPCLRFSVHAM